MNHQHVGWTPTSSGTLIRRQSPMRGATSLQQRVNAPQHTRPSTAPQRIRSPHSSPIAQALPGSRTRLLKRAESSRGLHSARNVRSMTLTKTVSVSALRTGTVASLLSTQQAYIRPDQSTVDVELCLEPHDEVLKRSVLGDWVKCFAKEKGRYQSDLIETEVKLR